MHVKKNMQIPRYYLITSPCRYSTSTCFFITVKYFFYIDSCSNFICTHFFNLTRTSIIYQLCLHIKRRSSSRPHVSMIFVYFKCHFLTKKEKKPKKQNKQEAHGPHRSPENQVKSINTFAHDKIRQQCRFKKKKDIITR